MTDCENMCYLVSPNSETQIRASQRDIKALFTTASIGALAAGDTVDVTLKAIGIPYSVRVTFAAPDSAATTTQCQIDLVVGGASQHNFLLGELVGTNANACAINACTVAVSVGAVEDCTVRLTNISTAVLLATAAVTMKLVRAFQGERGFVWQSSAPCACEVMKPVEGA